MLILGDREVDEQTVNIRERNNKQTFNLSIDKFIELFDNELSKSMKSGGDRK